MKCHKYWPDFFQGINEYNDLEIKLTEENSGEAYIIRSFSLSKGEELRTVQHFHFTSWPDHEAPDVNEFLEFIQLVRKTRNPSDGPMVVHCRFIPNILITLLWSLSMCIGLVYRERLCIEHSCTC